MQAAFVDVGLPRDGFLYVREAGGILDDFTDIFRVDDEPGPTEATLYKLWAQVDANGTPTAYAFPIGGKGFWVRCRWDI